MSILKIYLIKAYHKQNTVEVLAVSGGKMWVRYITLELNILLLISRCIYSFKILKISNISPHSQQLLFHYSHTCPRTCQYQWTYRELSADGNNFSILVLQASLNLLTMRNTLNRKIDQVLIFTQNLSTELSFFFLVFLSILCFIIWLRMVVKISKTAE